MFLAVFSNSLQDEKLEDGSERTVLKLPAVLAPIKAAILPLLKKDGLPEIANEIIDELKWSIKVQYDEKDAIGRRYRRQDANGTPYCVTVDHDTKEDHAVTVRDRDTMTQERVAIKDLKSYLESRVSMSTWLRKI
jgi:glycyl-tRNA synthetase